MFLRYTHEYPVIYYNFSFSNLLHDVKEDIYVEILRMVLNKPMNEKMRIRSFHEALMIINTCHQEKQPLHVIIDRIMSQLEWKERIIIILDQLNLNDDKTFITFEQIGIDYRFIVSYSNNNLNSRSILENALKGHNNLQKLTYEICYCFRNNYLKDLIKFPNNLKINKNALFNLSDTNIKFISMVLEYLTEYDNDNATTIDKAIDKTLTNLDIRTKIIKFVTSKKLGYDKQILDFIIKYVDVDITINRNLFLKYMDIFDLKLFYLTSIDGNIINLSDNNSNEFKVKSIIPLVKKLYLDYLITGDDFNDLATQYLIPEINRSLKGILFEKIFRQVLAKNYQMGYINLTKKNDLNIKSIHYYSIFDDRLINDLKTLENNLSIAILPAFEYERNFDAYIFRKHNNSVIIYLLQLTIKKKRVMIKEEEITDRYYEIVDKLFLNDIYTKQIRVYYITSI
jgi:hypothetical protein